MTNHDSTVAWTLAAAAVFYAAMQAPQPTVKDPLTVAAPVQATPTQAAESAEHSSHGDTSEVSPPPPADPHDALEGHDAPAVEEPVEWLTIEEARATGRPVLVFQHYADPIFDRGCRACRVLEKYLERPDVVAFFAERGACVSDTAERWQAGSPSRSAPAIAYLRPSAKEGDEIPIIKGRSRDNPHGFRLESSEAFLHDLKAWIDALEN